MLINHLFGKFYLTKMSIGSIINSQKLKTSKRPTIAVRVSVNLLQKMKRRKYWCYWNFKTKNNNWMEIWKTKHLINSKYLSMIGRVLFLFPSIVCSETIMPSFVVAIIWLPSKQKTRYIGRIIELHEVDFMLTNLIWESFLSLHFLRPFLNNLSIFECVTID